MHAEELKHKPIGTVPGIFLVLGIVSAILFCVFVVSFLQFWLKIFWLQFVLYGLMVVVAFFIVKYAIVEYIYLIEKDRISFGRRIGKREKELLFIPLREITSFGPYGEMQEKIKGKKFFRYTFRKRKDWFVIESAGCAVALTPTEEYIDCLKTAAGRGKRGADEPESVTEK